MRSGRVIGFLVVVFVLFGVAASADPAQQRKAWADTVQRMRVIHEALELYAGEHEGALPQAAGIDALAKALSPAYVRDLQRSDGWGHAFVYEPARDSYRIRSRGDGSGEIVLDDGHFSANAFQHLVPWEPFDAPLARISGTNQRLQRTARLVNASHSRAAMTDIRSIAIAVETYATEHNRYPAARTITELARFVEPAYIPNLPRVDPWLLPYYYTTSEDGASYWIRSVGSDLQHDREDEPEVPETSGDAAADCIYSNGHFLRQWDIRADAPAAARTKPAATTAPPQLPSTHFPIEWSFEIVQDGAVIPPNDGVAKVHRAPFTIRVTLPEVKDVRLNALGDDRVSRRMQPGFDFTSCRRTIVAFCNGTGMAEEDGNPQKQLILTESAMHYITEARWSRTTADDSSVVLERDVAMLGDTPIERTTLPKLYLVAYVPTGTELGQLSEHEIRKVRIDFQP